LIFRQPAFSGLAFANPVSGIEGRESPFTNPEQPALTQLKKASATGTMLQKYLPS
jgi:hypothetical protein